MINLKANQKLKNLGCKWDGSQWIAPELAEVEAQKIKDEFYSDMITIEVTTLDRLKGENFGYSHARTVSGYVVATAKGRDTGAVIYPGIAVIQGRFTSGGSMKNFICDMEDGTILKMKVSRNVIPILDSEVAENRYTYTILDNTENKESLLAQKEQLLKRIQEIDNILGVI